jgi:mobilome CxxCx(11)CxxC protein
VEDSLLNKARGYEFYCFGTARIFERRAQKLKFRRTWITFLGIVTPVVVGGVVLSFGENKDVLTYFLWAAGGVGLVQLVLSTWSIVARWDERYEYSVDSLKSNTDLYNRWKSFADENNNDSELFRDLKKEYERQEVKDIGQIISDKEKRFANRQSLLYYKEKCHICNNIPTSTKPPKCDGCGSY